MQASQDEVVLRSARFATLALLYLEQAGLVPRRFSEAAQPLWRAIMRYLREVDLLELAVRDGARANPHLFAAFRDIAARRELRAIPEGDWLSHLKDLQSRDLVHMSIQDLYRDGASLLGVDLPPAEEGSLAGRDLGRSSLVAELPNGCGYPSLLLCRCYEFLDPTHNLRIFVEGPTAEMLAAWAFVLLTRQLDLPSGRIIPVSPGDLTPLRRERFDVALIYRPVPWLPSDLHRVVAAQEFIVL